MSEIKPHENPLVPNKKLRQIYSTMVEARLLDEHIAALQRGVKVRRRLDSIRGQEACRVSTAIELQSGDLISDTQDSPAMDLLSGAKLDSLLRKIDAIASRAKERNATFTEGTITTRQLPWIDDVSDRLKIAMGAALTFKITKQTNIVVVYASGPEVPKGVWRQVLALAAKLNLPIIFVVLPDADAKKNDRAINICAKARSAGVPGIPVDANDAVALYRVAQESIGRTRGGDGPVLIECVPNLPRKRRSDGADDPVLHLKKFLVERKVCSEAWANHAGDVLRRKIASAISPEAK
ncbi:MAG: thiamine pyrophosphate-dependent enzyme [Edaphobacter sp.]